MKLSFKLFFLFAVIFLSMFFLPVKAVDELYYDLKVEGITVTPASPAINQDAAITVKIKNVGTWQIFDSTGLSSYTYEFGNFSVEAIDRTYPSMDNIIWPNDYVYYYFTGKFTKAGETGLSFTVNSNKALNEQLESEGYLYASYENNTLAKSLTVHENKYDLEVVQVVLSSNYPIINNSLDIKYVIRNSGEASLITTDGLLETDIPAYLSGFYLSDIILDSPPTTSSPLNPGKDYDIIYRGYFMQAGIREAYFKIDSLDKISETDENNNATTTVFTVYQNQAAADDFSILTNEYQLISSTSVKIIWSADREVTGKITYQRSGIYPIEEDISTAKKEHTDTLKNLWPGLAYSYKVTAYNGLAEQVTAWQEFTLPADDIITLNAPLAVAVSSSSAKFSWSTKVITDGYVYYKKKTSSSYKNKGSSSKTNNHEISAAELTVGDYEYYIESKSAPGAIYKSNAAYFSISASTPDEPDETEAPPNQDDGASPPAPDSPLESAKEIIITNNSLYQNLKGKIILKVEANGEAYYVNSISKKMTYLGRPDDAFSVMRREGVGITNLNLERIPIGLGSLSGADMDGDGLSDIFEDAIGTDKNKTDSDDDGFGDKSELESSYNPKGSGTLAIDKNFAAKEAGKIFLQVENNGEAWYINPGDKKRYFLGRPADAFAVMRNLGLGISNNNFNSL